MFAFFQSYWIFSPLSLYYHLSPGPSLEADVCPPRAEYPQNILHLAAAGRQQGELVLGRKAWSLSSSLWLISPDNRKQVGVKAECCVKQVSSQMKGTMLSPSSVTPQRCLSCPAQPGGFSRFPPCQGVQSFFPWLCSQTPFHVLVLPFWFCVCLAVRRFSRCFYHPGPSQLFPRCSLGVGAWWTLHQCPSSCCSVLDTS